jgi:hypothetical protein
VGGDGGAVCGRDGLHDGQSEAQAGPVVGPVRVQALERLEQPGDLVRRYRRAGVRHRQHRGARPRRGRQLQPTGGHVVSQRVVDEVDHEALDQARIAERVGLVELGREAQPASTGLGFPSEENLGGDVGQIDRLPAVEPALPAGQRQQRVDQPILLVRGAEHQLVGGAERFDGGVGVGQGDLDHRALPGEWCTQFV